MATLKTFAFIVATGLVLPAMADDTAPVCVNSGHQYKVGETACIAACHGERRLARCDVVAEKASWTFVSNVCPEALLPSGPGDATAVPIAVAMTPLPLPIERKMSEMAPEAWMRLATLMKANAASQ